MTPHHTLEQAIARLWPELPAHFGAEWPRVSLVLASLLRALEGDASEDAEEEIYALFASAPAALGALTRAVADLTKHADRAARAVRAAPAGRLERFMIVPVYYGTDRERDDTEGRAGYSGRRGSALRLGCAQVAIPDDHRMGTIERPRWWRLEFREDPERHVTITAVEELDRARFLASARSDASAGAPEALVFVHGYNVSFDDAVRRAAQVSYDLQFEGLAMLFSWPSAGTLQGYLADEASVRWAQQDFHEFLRLCLSELGLATVHVVAHSMGNRVLAEVLGAPVPVREDDRWARLDQIVFAAPDIDADTFGQLAARFHGRTGRCTLYASREDLALKQSHLFHQYPRAGYCVDGILVAAGVDAIDASAVDTSLMGHSYFGDNRSLLTDLFQLLRERQAPDGRFGLVAREGPTGRYWEFRP
ncbi:MAG TPA: alpha/beta hydrolase [Gemmatimonadaceae bacterium]|nr:alpha/beta hydrolase [Gemmatimonadaceae bacterium]